MGKICNTLVSGTCYGISNIAVKAICDELNLKVVFSGNLAGTCTKYDFIVTGENVDKFIELYGNYLDSK